MIEIFTKVKILKDVPEENVKAGDEGFVVYLYDEGKAASVEFVDADGAITALVTDTSDCFETVPMPTFELYENVAIRAAVPNTPVKAGDIGTVDHIHKNGELTVEFGNGEGKIEAMVTLSPVAFEKIYAPLEI